MKQQNANVIFVPVLMGVVALVVLFLLDFFVAWLAGSLSMIVSRGAACPHMSL